MEITKKPKIKSIPYEEFIDNESLEKLVKELNAGGANIALGVLDDFINWGRSNSLWPLTFATSCCGIEFMALGAARYDMARFGFEVARASPRQAEWSRQDSPGRCIHSRMPATSRSFLLWHDAIATQSENRTILWWSEQKREEAGLFK